MFMNHTCKGCPLGQAHFGLLKEFFFRAIFIFLRNWYAIYFHNQFGLDQGNQSLVLFRIDCCCCVTNFIHSYYLALMTECLDQVQFNFARRLTSNYAYQTWKLLRIDSFSHSQIESILVSMPMATTYQLVSLLVSCLVTRSSEETFLYFINS